jgi:hypothetical protein
MEDKPGGVLILKTFGQRPRIIPAPVDYELGERCIKQAERVNEHVAAGTLPDRIVYDPSVCNLCDFDQICQPVTVANISDVTDAQLKLIREYIALEGAYRERERLKKQLIGSSKKPGVFHGKNALVEDIQIVSRESDQTYYDVPDKIKKKYKKIRKIIKTSIGMAG